MTARVEEVLARLRAAAARRVVEAGAASGGRIPGDAPESDYCGECREGWRLIEGGGVVACPCREGVLRRTRQRWIDETLGRYRAGVASKLRSVSPLTFFARPEQGHVKLALDRYLAEMAGAKKGTDRVRGGGWLILGPPGVGKSYAAAYLVNRVRSEGFATAAMVNFARLLSALRATFRNETDHQGLFTILFETEVLAIDDLGMERKRIDEDPETSWSVHEFYKVIDHRYDDERPTIMTTNRSLDELEDRFGPAIYSRIRGMTSPLDLAGDDARRSR